jgi:DEAD/DEAH box helicase domain-containing protein
MAAPLVFDVETQNSFADVGNDTRKLKVSVVVCYDYATQQTSAYLENELPELFKLFEKASVLVGYNSEHFDLVVLNEYYIGDLFKFPHFDLLADIKEQSGHRYPLDDLVKATLNKGKSGNGLAAINLFREGKIKELTQYCQDDVLLTKELLDYGRQNGFVYLPTATSKNKLFVSWERKIKHIEGENNSQNLTLGF